MSGSSKSLIRDLNAVFEYWERHAHTELSIQTSQLFHTIRAFHEKHNTLQSIKQSTNIHNELYNFYMRSVQPKSDLPSEILFLSILRELLPVLSQKEVDLWLKTYLKPAVDSAHYDLKFVESSRSFINKVGIEYEFTDDPALNDRRHQIAIHIIKNIFLLYLDTDVETYENLGIDIGRDDSNSQLYWERVRFIKLNCLKIIYDFALAHPRTFANIANDHFLVAKTRLSVLSLLSNVLNSKSSKLHALVETTLFGNIFKSLLLDFDEKILHAGLSLLVMLVPLVSDLISKYSSDLLLIYIRVVLWQITVSSVPESQERIKDILKNVDESWELANDTSDDSYEISPKSHSVLDAGYLVTIIYGFFPYTITLFSRSPWDFFEEHPPIFISADPIHRINDILGEKFVSDCVITTTRNYLESFRLHPNFLRPDRLSLQYEKKIPTAWLIENKNDDSLGIEEIMIGCLNLNPSLGLYIPDDIDAMAFVNSGSDTALLDQVQSGKLKPIGSPSSWSNGAPSAPISRNSSLGGPSFFNFVNGHVVPNHQLSPIQRKLSIIPTNLIINNGSDISFKDINYSGEKPSVPENEKKSNPDPVQDLFSTHEKLYHPKALDYQSDGTVSTYSPSERGTDRDDMSRSESVSTFNNKDSINKVASSQATLNSDNKKSVSSNIGNVLDFYHRELLLLKNELEFASYMKHLTKFQYIKLKLQINKMKNSPSFWRQTNEYAVHTLEYDRVTSDYENLKASFDKLKQEYDTMVKDLKLQRETLLSDYLVLQEQRELEYNEVLQIKKDNQLLLEQIDELTTKRIPSKNELINTLTIQLDDLKLDLGYVKKELEYKTSNMQLDSSKKADDDESFKLNSYELEIQKLKNDLLISETKCEDLVKALGSTEAALEAAKKSFEVKMAANKNEIAYQLNTLGNQSDKKIQELNATILKYENFIEEKNLKIAQLSSSRPISIPGSVGSAMGSSDISRPLQYRVGASQPVQAQPIPTHANSSSNNPMDFYEVANRNNSNSSNESFSTNSQLPYNTPPLHTPVPMTMHKSFSTHSTQSVPIIKGRGGYQKRSKKHM